MKKFILLLIVPFLSFGQITPPPPPPDDDIIELKVNNPVVVDFAIVEGIPGFPGCEKSSANDDNVRRQADLQCFNAGIMNHIRNEFKYPNEAKEAGISEKIYVQFIIDKTGRIKDAKVVRGDNKYLKEEALRLINGLPKMNPAMQKDKPVGVPYTIPIHFKLE